MPEVVTESKYLTFVITFGASLLSTSLAWFVAKKVGFVNIPKEDRWNRRTVSLGGGIGIFAGILVGFFLPGTQPLLKQFLPPLTGVFAVGLIDDIWGVSPLGKLIAQAVAATYVVSQGFVLPLPWAVPAIALTVIWIVGISNSLNLLDNMDGLAAGAAAISGIALLICFRALGHEDYGHASAVLASAALGFLVLNFNPAKIFMGDAGSLSLGFLLATLSTKLHFVTPSEVPPVMVAVLVLMVLLLPVFDTALVIVSRRSAKRPITSGGRDHTSHRLVALGLSEKHAVIVLYILSMVGAIIATWLLDRSSAEIAIAAMGTLIVMTLFGLFLLDVVVYQPQEKKDYPGAVPLTFLYLIEIAIDICAISVVWLMAHYIRFYEEGYAGYYRAFSVIPHLPYLITSKLLACFAFKLYRGIWRNIWTKDVYQVFKAATFGSLLAMMGLALATRFHDISRIVLVIDWLLTFIALLGTRSALIAFRRWFRKMSAEPHKLALVGNSSLLPFVAEATRKEAGIEFAGLITDSPESHPQAIGKVEDAERIILEKGIDVLVVGTVDLAKKLTPLAARGVTIRKIEVYFA